MKISLTRTEATWGLRYWLFQLIFLPTLVSLILGILWPSSGRLALNLVCWGINFCVVFGIFHRFLLDSIENAKEEIANIVRTALTGLGLYLLLNWVVSIVIVMLFPGFFNVNNATIADTAQDNLFLMSLGTVVLVPIVEEMFYRGLVFGLLRQRSRVLAYTVCVLVFSAIHVVGYIGLYSPGHLLVCLVQYFSPALVLAYCYDRTENILTPTLLHMIINSIAMLAMR